MSHAVRRKLRRKEAQLAYEALTIEGGLLSPEWLARVGQQQAGGQAEADYRVPKGLSVRDEINRAWQIAQAHWQEFAAGRAAVEASGGDPRLLTERFVQGLLREAFGFGSLQAAAPVEVGGHRYPIGHAALSGQVPVVIAPAVSGGSGVDVLSAAFKQESQRIAMGLNGGMVILGMRTSKMGKRQFAEFIEFIQSVAVDRGVVIRKQRQPVRDEEPSCTA